MNGTRTGHRWAVGLATARGVCGAGILGVLAWGAAISTEVAADIVGWGTYYDGSSEVPEKVPSGLARVVAISAGANHALALTDEGRVVGWGANDQGQAQPPSGLSNVVAIAAGASHSLALTRAGRVVSWGFGTTPGWSVNVPPAGLSNVVEIAAGYFHSLALTRAGRVVAWGNSHDGSTWVPATVPGGLSNVVKVATGTEHSLALKVDGSLVAWGRNFEGQANVPAGLKDVIAMAAGWGHSLALTASGKVVAWGSDTLGKRDVPAGLSNVVGIAAGDSISLALTADGRVVTWGEGANPPPGLTNVKVISARRGHGVALTPGPAGDVGFFRVPGTANPWLAGARAGTSAGSGDVAPNHSPVVVSGIVGGRTYTVIAQGLVNNGPGWPWAGPEGYPNQPESHGSQNGIGEVRSWMNALVGVFLDDRTPSATSTLPSPLDFTVLGREFLALSPALRQPFFVGDGRTGDGVAQRFTAPAGATRLFLGTMDSFEWNNNSGFFTVQVSELGVRPEITVQPPDQSVLLGGQAAFTLTVVGTPPLSYRWRTNAAGGGWGDWPGGTNATLALAQVQPSHAGGYQAVVWNAYGIVTSRVARLSVEIPTPVRRVTNTVWVGTMAGSGAPGYADGGGQAARFNAPNGGFVDPDGNVWIADSDNHRIRRITPDGTVTTVAGSGVPGFADGPATTSQFSYPLGVCVDALGNVHVADAGNNRVRKITSAGVVSTLAGTGVGGYRDGPGGTAWLNFPNDLVVDGAGNVYVTEFDNHTVRRIAPDGTTTTWVGNGQPGHADGPRAEARLNQPGGIALDKNGNLYVSEYGGQRIRKVTPAGIVSTLAGDGTAGHLDGEGTRARFQLPDGIVVDVRGDLYLADHSNHVIRRIRPDGQVETVAGTGVSGLADGSGWVAQFAYPTGIGVDADGVLYVADGLNHRIRWIVMDPRPVTITREPQPRNVPAGASVRFEVSASGTPPIRYQWRREGTNLVGATSAALVLDSVQPAQAGAYTVVVSNVVNVVTSQVAGLVVTAPIRHVLASMAVSTWAGSGVAGHADGARADARFNGPNGGWVDGGDNVYVADGNNHRIRRIAPDGSVTTLAGSGIAGFADGPADQARFSYPLGVCLDSNGNVFVADAGNNRVRKVSPEGVVSTVAGTGVGGYRDGAGSTALLNFPNDLVADALGNLWVTEYDNHTVRRIAPDGTVSTWVGNGTAGYVDGPRGEARLTQPGGIALDRTGNLYVSEYGGHRIRKVMPGGVVTTVAGTGVAGHMDGEGATARFRNPDGIVVGVLGYLYVADHGNHAVRRISPTGFVETVAGTGEAGVGEGVGTEARFWNPTGVGLGANGVLYVIDGMNQRVCRVSPPGIQFLGLGNGMLLNWAGTGWTLQSGTNVGTAMAWRDVGGPTNGPVQVPSRGAGSQFYRLRDASVAGGPGVLAGPDPAPAEQVGPDPR